MKIAKAEETDKGMQVYGDAGNVVHNACEDYWNNKVDTFKEHWNKLNIDEQFGFKNTKLSYNKFYTMYKNAVNYMDNIKCIKSKTELKIEKEILGMKFKGFIDLYTETKDDIIIYDWKTNSTHDYNMHKKQRLLYSWLIWKIKGVIPICKWVYLKNTACEKFIIKEKFIEKQLEDFQLDILNFKSEIELKGDDITKYNGGDWKNPFNKYYSLCRAEIEKRQNQQFMEVHLAIKGNFVFFEGDVDPKLEEGIDFKTKFDLPDKYYMQEAVKKKARGKINLEEVGTVHLYNKKFKCFPIGLMEQIKTICDEFAIYYNKKMKIFITDKRDPNVFNRISGVMKNKLITDKIFRPYQLEAIEAFMEKKSGIINIPTGGGKTFVATELIRRADTKTLWIIDRKELLTQTKNTLRELLGIEIGEIAGGKVDIKNVTISTIQSLHSKINELKDYLYNINFVIVDEYHKSAAETYQKVFSKTPNLKYRLGLTATPFRDDGKTPILFSILGEVIYKISVQELIKLGYLVRPEIIFIDMLSIKNIFKQKYVDDYKNNIVECEIRNYYIKNICRNSRNKKIIILTKQVNHGKLLKDIISNSKHIHGSSKDREQIMKDFKKEKFNILIMTLSIGAEGLDIPDLDIIINAGANKGDGKSIQILGRVLRLFKNKDSAIYVDFVDVGHHTYKHSMARIKAFEDQGHEVKRI